MLRSYADFGKARLLKGLATKVVLHPKELQHPVEVRSWLEYRILRKILRRNAYEIARKDIDPVTILDAGANVGFSAVYFASRYPRTQICAVEPDEGNFRQLQKNCAPYSNIDCVYGAICGTPRKLFVVNPVNRIDSFQVRDEGVAASRPVDGITVSQLLNRMGWDRISLLKMDIEGSEEEVFRENAEAWIGLVDVFAIEVHDTEERQASRALFAALAATDRSYALRPKGENLIIKMYPSAPKDNAEYRVHA